MNPPLKPLNAVAAGQILGAWLRHRGLPVATLSGAMTPARLLASPDALRPSERDWLQTFAAKHGADTEAS